MPKNKLFVEHKIPYRDDVTVVRSYHFICADCEKDTYIDAQDQRYAAHLARRKGWGWPASLMGWLCPKCVKVWKKDHPKARFGNKSKEPMTQKQMSDRVVPVPKQKPLFANLPLSAYLDHELERLNRLKFELDSQLVMVANSIERVIKEKADLDASS